MIHEHQVLCLLENDSLMSATEEQTNKPNDLCNQVTTNTERTPNSCNISQAAGSCANPSMINSIKVQSKKFPSTSQQLKSTNRKSVQCSTSSTSSSSSLTLPQNNTKHIKTSMNPFSSSRINNKTISMNKNKDPLKLVNNPSKNCFITKTVNHSLDSNSSLNLQKMKKNNTIKSKGFSK
ncbi:TRAF-type zinc finger domain containing 1, variant 2 [Schistosoma haematobium]|nr:TRAF-type zinc finger domain containing 1, variant 2 [Schistosoma haematobium]KAH9582522.1 TRAF-type zinc finger domain containing 1, variant 2 [Schistosoma haematobium]